MTDDALETFRRLVREAEEQYNAERVPEAKHELKRILDWRRLDLERYILEHGIRSRKSRRDAPVITPNAPPNRRREAGSPVTQQPNPRKARPARPPTRTTIFSEPPQRSEQELRQDKDFMEGVYAKQKRVTFAAIEEMKRRGDKETQKAVRRALERKGGRRGPNPANSADWKIKTLHNMAKGIPLKRDGFLPRVPGRGHWKVQAVNCEITVGSFTDSAGS